jgi:peroxiredoxin
VVERNKLPFAILSDPRAEVIRAYGVLHERGGPGGTDIALPAHFLIDRSGRIAWRYVADKVNHRPIPGDLIRRINELR